MPVTTNCKKKIQKVLANDGYSQAMVEKENHNKLNKIFIPAKEDDANKINFSFSSTASPGSSRIRVASMNL